MTNARKIGDEEFRHPHQQQIGYRRTNPLMTQQLRPTDPLNCGLVPFPYRYRSLRAVRITRSTHLCQVVVPRHESQEGGWKVPLEVLGRSYGWSAKSD